MGGGEGLDYEGLFGKEIVLSGVLNSLEVEMLGLNRMQPISASSLLLLISALPSHPSLCCSHSVFLEGVQGVEGGRRIPQKGAFSS